MSSDYDLPDQSYTELLEECDLHIAENKKLRDRIELLEDTLREVIELHASYDNIVKTIFQVIGDEVTE